MFKSLSFNSINLNKSSYKNYNYSLFYNSSYYGNNHNSLFVVRLGNLHFYNKDWINYLYPTSFINQRLYSILLSRASIISIVPNRIPNQYYIMDINEDIPRQPTTNFSTTTTTLSPAKSLNKSTTSTPNRSPSASKRKRLHKSIDSDSSDMETKTTEVPIQTAEKHPAKITLSASPVKTMDTSTITTTAAATTSTTTTAVKPIHPFFAPRVPKPVVVASTTTTTVKETSTTTAPKLVSPPETVTINSSTITTVTTPVVPTNPVEPVKTSIFPTVSTTISSSTLADEEDVEESLASIKKKGAAEKGKKKKSKIAASDNESVSLDENEADSSVYHPVRSAPWKSAPGTPIPYSALVSVFSDIEATTKRLAIVSYLTNFFRSVIALCPDDLVSVLYLCTNSIAPAYENLELGVGDSLLIKALSEATGRQAKDIKSDMEEKGDLGLVAESSRARQRTLFASTTSSTTSSLTVRSVFASFRTIAAESGRASQDKKVSTIKRLLVSCQGAEAKYIIRSMQGKLRIGVAEQSVLIALAHAFVLTPPLVEGAAAGRSEVYGPTERGGENTNKPNTSSLTTNISSAYPPVLMDTSRKPDLDKRLEEGSALLKQVFSELPSYDAIVPVLLRRGLEGARKECQLVPGIPVTPMLAKPTKGIREVLDRFENIPFTCEWKYDGERAQIHVLSDGSVRVFSRNSEDTTSKYPDLGIALKMAMGRMPPEPIYPANTNSNVNNNSSSSSSTTTTITTAEGEVITTGPPVSSTPFFKPAIDTTPRVPVVSCVLDGEAVAYDRERGVLLPFQILSTRARKDVSMESIKVQVIYVAFDLLYLNNQSLLHVPLKQRREALRSSFTEIPGRFAFAQAAESNDTEEIGAFLNDSVKGGCEGLMVKVLEGSESVYEPSKRSLNWLKLKKDYMDGLTDSFDLVPVAAWKGKGKRTGVYGAYLLACYDPENDDYQSVCKVGTGFSDEALIQLAAVFNDNKDCIRTTKPRNVVVGDSLSDADVWFIPEDSEVWEVMAADLSISPVHMGAVGKVDSSKGIGLRFPRFLRRRDAADKGPTDATTAAQILDMYRSQASVSASGGMMDDDDDY